ncbi:hypothetical protein FQA47_003502 [Oryzias melastigma]|uniref:Ig-like domain-containing protein n=1 Tax=Oryzias melastigma TaxID=30732 RepID=A0A834FAT4_ORYME|nr:hypothetical protein FQA47_003502 [Oryzias melastigma]
MMIESMLCLLLAAGADLVLTALVVQQTPEMVFTHPGREVVLDCYHGDNDYPYMLWYQFGSAAGGGRVMALIGLLSYESPSVEKDFQGGFRLTGDARGEAQLRISSVNSTDAAEYFCAARRHSGSCQRRS